MILETCGIFHWLFRRLLYLYVLLLILQLAFLGRINTILFSQVDVSIGLDPGVNVSSAMLSHTRARSLLLCTAGSRLSDDLARSRLNLRWQVQCSTRSGCSVGSWPSRFTAWVICTAGVTP